MRKFNDVYKQIIFEELNKLPRNMDIHIRIKTKEGNTFWYVKGKNGSENFLVEGETLAAIDPYGDEYQRGSSFSSWKDAIDAAKDAKTLVRWNNFNVKNVTFWTLEDGEQVPIKPE